MSQLVDAPAVNGLKVRRATAGGKDEKDQVQSQVEDLMTMEHEARKNELARTGGVMAAARGAGRRFDQGPDGVDLEQEQRQKQLQQLQSEYGATRGDEEDAQETSMELVIAPAPPPHGKGKQKQQQMASAAGRGGRTNARNGAGAGGAIVTKEELVDFFALHNPQKMQSVERLLKQFQGPEREAKMCEMLKKRYGEAPPLRLDSARRGKVELVKARQAREGAGGAGGAGGRQGAATAAEQAEMDALKRELAEVREQLKQQVLGGEGTQGTRLPQVAQRAQVEVEEMEDEARGGRRGSNASSSTSSNYQKYGVSMRRGSFYQAPWDGMEGDGMEGDESLDDDDAASLPPPMPPRDASEDEDEERERYERMLKEEQGDWDIEDGRRKEGGGRGGRRDEEIALSVEELVVYFRLYNPSKVENAPKLLRSFAGREGKLCKMLEDKYGVHPLDAMPERKAVEKTLQGQKKQQAETTKRMSKIEQMGARHIEREQEITGTRAGQGRGREPSRGRKREVPEGGKRGDRRASFSNTIGDEETLKVKEAEPIVDEYLDTLCTYVGGKLDKNVETPDDANENAAATMIQSKRRQQEASREVTELRAANKEESTIDTSSARRRASFSTTVGQEETVDAATAEVSTDAFLDTLCTLVGMEGGDPAEQGANTNENAAATMIQSKRRQQEASREVTELRTAKGSKPGTDGGDSEDAQEAVDICLDRLINDVAGTVSDVAGTTSRHPSTNAAHITNAAYIFIKPHAANDQVSALIESSLHDAGITITSKGEIGYAKIDLAGLIDNHYGAIAAKATKLKPSELSLSAKAQADFKGAFGVDWTEALANDEVYNAMDAGAKLGLDYSALDAKWSGLNRGVDLIKFGGGFYAGKINGIYVINGFYMAMRAKYTTAPAKILFYTVEWAAESMSWTDFRGKLIGATDPTSADAGSLRGKVYSQWESMGLSAQPDTGDNSVHASASPFEGLVERLNWVGAELDLDPFGKLLLGAGVSTENAMAYAQDPQVSFDGEMTSLFDLLEDTDADECCAKVVKVQAEAQEANAAATMIQSKRRQQEASREVTELRSAKVVEAGASKASCTGDKGQYQLQIGDVVQAKPPDETLYFEGVVVELHGDGAADVDFGHEDGDEDDGTEHKYSRVPKENIRRAMEWSTLETGDHVKARHDGGYQEFEAIVIAVHPDGTYDVRYDDDEVEEDVAADMLTKILSGRMQAARRWHKAKSMLSAVSFFRHTGSKDNAVVGSGRAATSTINSTPA
jgi:hypothetical protein